LVLGEAEAIGLSEGVEPDPALEQAAMRNAEIARIPIAFKPGPW
jgi:hypothetical protein